MKRTVLFAVLGLISVSFAENVEIELINNCDEGFKLNGDGICQQRVTACDSNSVVSNDEFSCQEIPADSHKEDEYHWACNEGFVEKGEQCFQEASCDKTEYYVDEFTCSQLPSNAHAKGYGWECDNGYYSNGYLCLAVPANAHKNEYDNGWECNYGYQEDNNNCKKLAVCNSNQYKVDDFTCTELPAYAHKVYENSWECDNGYVNTSYKVCEEIPTCSDNEVLNKTYNRCDKIPSHAEKVSDESWRRKKGYHTKYEGGESFCKSDPLNIYNNLSLEFAGNLGTQMIDKTGYDYMTDVEDPFFIEGEIGVE